MATQLFCATADDSRTMRTTIWLGEKFPRSAVYAGPTCYPPVATTTDSPLAAYGCRHADYVAMAAALQRAQPRLTSQQHAAASALSYSGHADNLRVISAKDACYGFVPLEAFLPYFSTLDVNAIASTIARSTITGQTRGTCPFGLDRNESDFVRDCAIPAILQAKTRAAHQDRSRIITIGLKSFGVGYTGDECRQMAMLLLAHLQDPSNTSALAGARIILTGFDIDSDVRLRAPEYLLGGLRAAAERHRWRDHIAIELELYYGDLTDTQLLPAMLLYGAHDMAMWRNTHVCRYGGIVDNGAAILSGLRNTLARPGGLIVQEWINQPPYNRLSVQELLTA